MQTVKLSGAGIVTPFGINDFQSPPKRFSDWYPFLIDDGKLRLESFKKLKRFNRAIKMSIIAAELALSKFKSENATSDHETGIVISTNHTNLHPILKLNHDAKQFGVNNTNPSLFPDTVLNVLGGHLSKHFGFTGTNVTISDGAFSSMHALLYAVKMLEKNQLSRVLLCDVQLKAPSVFNGNVSYNPPVEFVAALLLERNTHITNSGLDITMGRCSIEHQSNVELLPSSQVNLSLAIALANGEETAIYTKTVNQHFFQISAFDKETCYE
ncbi:beta-ketoacyl synthase N-terminal-like domain-containing protein [Fictibacillus enclensis]|uniref:beta-ketoacyl synthase N-terminal-like domain-containing protein n=1 Tax=Fictibacillus enclensis TaxID=1017270 RepID=UPI0025A0E425|nr:beta-ketoacyl synthase N-terminal-like domain-containing protein [Fictibacillus enclensis]MDM5335834.1 beta-ketoacyl synthase N-terminal-like domain-containing protein [Fictibacillus enclensis]